MQLGELEKVAYALAQARQFHPAAGGAARGLQRTQRSKPAAIDVIHFAQIQHHLRALDQQFLDGVAQVGRYFSEHNSTATVHHRHALHRSCAHSQLHRRLFSKLRSKTQCMSLPRPTPPRKRPARGYCPKFTNHQGHEVTQRFKRLRFLRAPWCPWWLMVLAGDETKLSARETV